MQSITRLYTKRYTMKEWNRFPWVKQEILCRKYNIIITDWIPKHQRIINKVNHILDKTTKGVNKFSKSLEKFDMSNFKIFDGVSQKTYNNLAGMPSREYSSLLGNKTKRDYSTLTGKR